MARYLALLLFFVFFVFFLFSPIAPEVHSTSMLSKPIRASLKHIDAMGSFTKAELLLRAAHRSKNRLAALTSERSVTPENNTSLQAPVKAGTGEFLMNLGVGTPAVTFAAIVDSGSDLVWTQCRTCVGCPTSVYNPLKSSTIVTTIPCNSSLCQSLDTRICSSGCNYNYTYDDGSSTFGPLGIETFSFNDSISVDGITFGCSSFTQGDWDISNGLVGLGQGPLSLITQLGSPNFSYCFTSFGDSTTSPLIIGDLVLKDGQSTPIIPNPSSPSSYYLSLKGITVGSTLLPIPNHTFAIKADGTGGLVIDSGTQYTLLVDAGYQLLKEELQSQVKLTVADGSSFGLDLCFELPSDDSSVTPPFLIFHFDGADMNLPVQNYLTETDTGLLCLTIQGSTESTHISILGNYQQQNFLVLYDVDGATLSFKEANCDQL